jgi:hypothetical protein
MSSTHHGHAADLHNIHRDLTMAPGVAHRRTILSIDSLDQLAVVGQRVPQLWTLAVTHRAGWLDQTGRGCIPAVVEPAGGCRGEKTSNRWCNRRGNARPHTDWGHLHCWETGARL